MQYLITSDTDPQPWPCISIICGILLTVPCSGCRDYVWSWCLLQPLQTYLSIMQLTTPSKWHKPCLLVDQSLERLLLLTKALPQPRSPPVDTDISPEAVAIPVPVVPVKTTAPKPRTRKVKRGRDILKIKVPFSRKVKQLLGNPIAEREGCSASQSTPARVITPEPEIAHAVSPEPEFVTSVINDVG